MATKKQPAQRNSAKKQTASTKSSKGSVGKKIVNSPVFKEKNPENHKVTGKYKFLYVLFMCTTIFFAALSVWLFVFSAETLNKYESIKACTRAHTRCNVRYDGGDINVEGEE